MVRSNPPNPPPPPPTGRACFKGLGVDLEEESMRYIEMHRGPAARGLGPPPSRGGDLELEGGFKVLWKYGVVHGTLTWSGV